jgi:hypothetical protein
MARQRTAERALSAMSYMQQPYYIMKNNYGAAPPPTMAGGILNLVATIAGSVLGMRQQEAVNIELSAQQERIARSGNIMATKVALEKLKMDMDARKYIPIKVLGGVFGVGFVVYAVQALSSPVTTRRSTKVSATQKEGKRQAAKQRTL